MDTSKNDFDVVLSLIKNFDVSIYGFPAINSAFSTISIPLILDIDDALIKINDDAWNIMMRLYFGTTIDGTKIKLIESMSLSFVLLKNLAIDAKLKSLEKISLNIGILPVRISASFWERLPINAELMLGKLRIIADASVGFWRRLSTWDYDDTPQEVPIGYWNTKLLSELDYKNEEEYV